MIATRFTRAFGLDHPIVSAPMARASGGRLAAAVSGAGALGLIGGGYGDTDWIASEFEAAGNAPVGCGLITWRLQDRPEVLDAVLARAPRALFLSFGDPAPYAAAIAQAGVPLICQVQSVADARAAIDAGASVIVAQGGEAGGHGARRATLTLVPEVADFLSGHAPEVMLLAAGGIADGRGLAAALMLGADGVVMGTRFWASDEALVHAGQMAAALAASGDGTVRTRVVDIARGFDWPDRFDIRVLGNAFTDRWDSDPEALQAAPDEISRWVAAWESGDAATGNAIVGEGIGLIRDCVPAARIVEEILAGAEALLAGGWKR